MSSQRDERPGCIPSVSSRRLRVRTRLRRHRRQPAGVTRGAHHGSVSTLATSGARKLLPFGEGLHPKPRELGDRLDPSGESRPSATRAAARARISTVITRGIRGYLSRDWAAARQSKDAFWATRIARLGPIEGLRIADELRRQVVRQNPAWPGDEERSKDLAAHTRLSELLRRAGRPRSR